MSDITMDVVLSRLSKKYPDVIFAGGERSEGFWIKAAQQQGTWAWERWRVTSPGACLSFAEVALFEFHGA